MNFILKKILFLILVISTSSCSFVKINEIHGVTNLQQGSKILEIGKINKTNTIEILGPPPLVDFNNQDIWYYLEIKKTKNLFGNNEITDNNLLLLQFNHKEILIKKKFLDKNQMKKIEFDSNQTSTLGVDNSLLKNILSSTKKRLDNLAKKNK